MPIIQKGGKGIAWVIDLQEAARWRFAGINDGSDLDPDTLPPAERKAWYEGETRKRDLQIKDRELIPAADVERAIATAFAAISADIWAIPDNLERRHGVGADVAAQVGELLADAMDAMTERLSELAPVDGEVEA